MLLFLSIIFVLVIAAICLMNVISIADRLMDYPDYNIAPIVVFGILAAVCYVAAKLV
jgi:hypothetical protein